MDNYAATPGEDGIRVLLSVGLAEDDVFITGDFSVAFMHTELDEDVFAEPLPEMGIAPGYVFKLDRAVNGLRSSLLPSWLVS